MNRSMLSCALLTISASTASAQPAPAPPAEGPAEQAYQRGRKHYDLQEWDQAIAEFKEAYRIRNDAASLFNIAQSYRLKGDCAQAAAFYKTYRRNYPDAPNIARAEQFITEMEECANRAAPTSPGTPTDTTGTGTTTQPEAPSGDGTTSSVPVRPPTPQPPPQPERGAARPSLGQLGIGVAGAGVACILGGIVFAVKAQSIEEDVLKLQRWDPDLDDRGVRADLTAKVLFAVGGAAMISGGIMMYLGYRTVEYPGVTAVRIVPRAGGAAVSWSARF